MRGEANEEYYQEGERLLKQQGTIKDYNNWSDTLCQWGEYKKALFYIKECLRMSPDEVKDPNFLDTYGECLYGLGMRNRNAHMASRSLRKEFVISFAAGTERDVKQFTSRSSFCNSL